MSRISRRRFVKSTAAAAAASSVFPLFTVAGTKASGKVLGANERLRHGVVGINSQGSHHLRSIAGMEDVDLTCLVDPDSRLFDSRTKMAKDAGGTTPKCVQDVRQALEDKNIDTISIATCNHWHSLIAIWACQAGKDVYVEKPISHNVWEGRKLVEAAKAYDRVVQHGTQQRTDQGRADEISAVHSGKYGKLLVSKGYCCKPRWSIGVEPVQNPPAELDFNIWLGPAAERPFHANLVHYNWHWFWDFGNGDIGNQGVHEMDVARWAIKDTTLPTRVWSLGGRFGYQDQGETPNTELSVYEHGDVLLVFETRGLVEKHEGFPRKVLNEYYTTEGVIRNGKFHPKNGGSGINVEGDGSIRVTPGGQFGSFFAAVRSRKPEDINANAEEGHYSAAHCHLGNISYRLGSATSLDKVKKTVANNVQLQESFEKIQENLRAVGVKLEDSTYQLGRVLEFDPHTERFVNDDDANALLTRPYRKPFVVPENV